MKIVDTSGTHVQCYKCSKPKFREHRGRTWDHEEVLFGNQIIKFFYDSTWGEFYYFALLGIWYKCKISECTLAFHETIHTL